MCIVVDVTVTQHCCCVSHHAGGSDRQSSGGKEFNPIAPCVVNGVSDCGCVVHCCNVNPSIQYCEGREFSDDHWVGGSASIIH